MEKIAQNTKSDYKHTELGIIPKKWNWKLLSNIAKIERGKFTHRPRNDPKYYGGDYPFIQTGDVVSSNGKIITFTQTLNEKGLSVSKLFSEKIIVMTIAANIGNTAITTFPICFPDSLVGISTNELDIEYLEYFLRTKKNFLNNIATNSAQKNINLETLKPLYILVPDQLNEQQKISGVLSDMGNLINNMEKLIEKKKNIKQGTMQELVTGKRRLEGFSTEWESKSLSKILDYEQPTEYLVKNTEYNDKYSIPVLTAGKTFILGYTNEKNSIFQNVPVIIFDDFTTSSKYVDFSFKAKSSAMKILKPKNENVNLKFVYERMQLINFPLGNHKRHWISEFSNLLIKVPECEEQNKISQIISDMELEIKQLETQKKKYSMIKQGMMQKLLTGEIRIK